MPKQTRLDEHAEIYQPRRQQTEKEKLREMSFRGKLSYLWEYYRIHAAVTAVVLALIVYFVYTILNPAVKPQLYAAIINSTVTQEAIDQYKADFAEHLQLDPKRQSVELNNTFYMSSTDQFSVNSQQVLSTYMGAGEVDIVIAPESNFKNYASIGYFAKLSDELPTDVYSSLTQDFLISATEDDPGKNAYGIYLTDSDLFNNLTYGDEPYVLGIVPNYPHKDNTVEFIRYLFKNSK